MERIYRKCKSAGPCLSGATRLRGVWCIVFLHPVSYASLYPCIDILLFLYPGSWMLHVGYSILDSAIWMEECGLGKPTLPPPGHVIGILGPPHMQHMLQIRHISPTCSIICSHRSRNTALEQHMDPQNLRIRESGHPSIRESKHSSTRESENPSIRVSENPRIQTSEYLRIRESEIDKPQDKREFSLQFNPGFRRRLLEGMRVSASVS